MVQNSNFLDGLCNLCDYCGRPERIAAITVFVVRVLLT
ncbi:unnamed protein product [Brassica rapa]|uniref:Uncharacterized protein n=2 Tax=Brassica TaxID=3705 RepID=A0A8D9DC58_BRACM|nr:unnamed protein product [Brassica napus]CAG7872811.1 unnamed protein product [Brassica rapa]